MMPDFVQIDRNTFYTDIWPRIKNEVEAVESNWADAKNGARPIVIKWGYKDKKTDENVILAITRADDSGEEYFVHGSLIAGV